MIDAVGVFLPMVLYICGIVLLIILSILGVKLIFTLDRVNKLIDDVENKVKTLDTAFDIIDKTSNSILGIGDTIVGAVNSVISRIVHKKRNLEEDDYNE